MQEIRYQAQLAQWMPMGKAEQQPLEVALAAFAVKLNWLIEHNELSESELGRRLNKEGHDIAIKTINNIANERTSAELGNLSALAAHFDVPLWVMFIPDLPLEILKKPALQRLEKLVQNYIASNDTQRGYMEGMAAGYAGLNSPK